MSQAKRKTTTTRSRRPQREAQMAESMQALYRWRDERRAYAAQLAAAKHEERWGGARSIGLLVAISAVMIGALVAGSGLI